MLASVALPSFATETSSKVALNLNLRYETVSQDNAKKDASALTLRSTLNFQSASISNVNAVLEFEDNRVVAGIDEYNDTNGKYSDYSVIADPETTELDQGYLQYKANGLTAKLGRQVLTFDNHRFVGHVGWRQDKQTFDGTSFSYQATSELTINYAYITKRNRIFAEQKDINANDHLINISYKTAYGKLTGYSYLLDEDKGVSNSLDTYGASFTGKSGKIPYAIEFASQESKNSLADYRANYLMLETGYIFDYFTIKLGLEQLASDGGDYGFSTPLATLHKFNGWSDQFLTTPKQGLKDVYAFVAGKAWNGQWKVIYHDFSADEQLASADDLGTEINAVYSKTFNKQYTLGIKFAKYSAGDSVFNKVDTDKLWLWISAKF